MKNLHFLIKLKKALVDINNATDLNISKIGCTEWDLNPCVLSTVDLKSTSLDHSDISAIYIFV